MSEYQKWLQFQHTLVLFISSMEFGDFKVTNSDVFLQTLENAIFEEVKGNNSALSQ